MDIKEIEKKARRDFNNAICLMGIIPIMVFVYILVEKVASFRIFAGDVGYIVFIVLMLLALGIITGREMLWAVIARLFNLNQQIIKLQEELVEKSRLSAITQTALALGHEINNPLMVMSGNLELLEYDFQESNFSDQVKDRLVQIKNHCERIREATSRLSNLYLNRLQRPFTAIRKW